MLAQPATERTEAEQPQAPVELRAVARLSTSHENQIARLGAGPQDSPLRAAVLVAVMGDQVVASVWPRENSCPCTLSRFVNRGRKDGR